MVSVYIIHLSNRRGKSILKRSLRTFRSIHHSSRSDRHAPSSYGLLPRLSPLFHPIISLVSCSHLISPQYYIASVAVRRLHKMWCICRSDNSMAPWCLSLGTRLGGGFAGEDGLAELAASSSSVDPVEKQQQSSRELHLLLNGSTPALLLSLLQRITYPRWTQAHEHLSNPPAVRGHEDAREEDLRRTRGGSMHLTFTEPQ